MLQIIFLNKVEPRRYIIALNVPIALEEAYRTTIISFGIAAVSQPNRQTITKMNLVSPHFVNAYQRFWSMPLSRQSLPLDDFRYKSLIVQTESCESSMKQWYVRCAPLTSSEYRTASVPQLCKSPTFQNTAQYIKRVKTTTVSQKICICNIRTIQYCCTTYDWSALSYITCASSLNTIHGKTQQKQVKHVVLVIQPLIVSLRAV